MMKLEAGEFLPPVGMYDVILEKQGNWAHDNVKLHMTGSEQNYYMLKNGQCYTFERNLNLFIPLSKESIEEFNLGYGKELTDDKQAGAPKIHALHSSSALVVNIFEYWRQKRDYTKIAKALGIKYDCIDSMHYEGIDKSKKYKFTTFSGTHPSTDVHFEYTDGSVVGLECKYTEPFNRRDIKNEDWVGFQKTYIKKNNYFKEQLPKLFEFTEKLVNENKNNQFKYLDVRQLITHIIGMEATIRDRNKYYLIYLYYPSLDFFYPSINERNKDYEMEIELFSNELDLGINFSALTWFDLLRCLYQDQGNMDDNDKRYLYYNINRY